MFNNIKQEKLMTLLEDLIMSLEFCIVCINKIIGTVHSRKNINIFNKFFKGSLLLSISSSDIEECILENILYFFIRMKAVLQFFRYITKALNER